MARRRDPQTGKLLPEGIYPVVSERTGVVRYRARSTYMSGGKRRHISKTKASPEAAIEWKLETDLKLNRGIIDEPNKITVSTYFESWYRQRSPNWSGSRQRAVQSSWKKYVLPEIGHLPVNQVARRHIQRLIETIIEGGCSSRTAGIYIAGVRSMFRDAIIDDIIQRNPCHDLVYPKQPRTKRPTWSVLELRRYIGHLQSSDTPHRTVLLFIAATGCRIGEALALHWQDIDLIDRTVWIHRTLSSDVYGRLKVVNRTKTSEDGRVIPLPSWLCDELDKVKKETGLVWSQDGRTILPNDVRDNHYATIDTLKLTPLRVHDLRHTVGSILHANGVDYRTIQDLLGHENSQTTLNTYVHPHMSMLRQGVDTVSRSLGYSESDTTTSRESEAK